MTFDHNRYTQHKDSFLLLHWFKEEPCGTPILHIKMALLKNFAWFKISKLDFNYGKIIFCLNYLYKKKSTIVTFKVLYRGPKSISSYPTRATLDVFWFVIFSSGLSCWCIKIEYKTGFRWRRSRHRKSSFANRW